LHQNKEAALANLKAKFAQAEFDRIAGIKRDRHESKPDAAFGQHIRTARMCGNSQGVVDHRTGIEVPISAVTKGEIDRLVIAAMRWRLRG
jgi:protein subunit release factor A